VAISPSSLFSSSRRINQTIGSGVTPCCSRVVQAANPGFPRPLSGVVNPGFACSAVVKGVSITWRRMQNRHLRRRWGTALLGLAVTTAACTDTVSTTTDALSPSAQTTMQERLGVQAVQDFILHLDMGLRVGDEFYSVIDQVGRGRFSAPWMATSR
jgi:hypothetical protein